MKTGFQRRSGFTIIEVSISMIIIGFLIAGVLVGRDMIRLMEMRSIIADIERYNTAVQTFRAKYSALPGDMTDAEAIWGSDAACPATPNTNTPHTATCNGNGDGFMGDHDWFVNDFRESYRAVQQLANAGLLAGQYSGTADTATGLAVVGINTMKSRIEGAGYFPLRLHDDVATLGPTIYYPGHYGHSYMFGKPSVIFDITVDATISGPDAAGIDSKIDDGMAGAGNVLTFVPGNGFVASNCATTASATTARYTSATSVECSLLFRQQF